MNCSTTTLFTTVWRLFLCFGITGISFSHAQPARYFFEHLTTKDGLSQNDVNCILQDETGFMWFGTNDGLNRYDGYEFEVFRPRENDTTSIISNLIQVLTIDHLGRIWIGTAGEGISCFLPKYQRFVNFKDIDDPNFNLQGDFILDISIDEHKRMWVGTSTGMSLLQLNDVYEPSPTSIKNLTSSVVPSPILRGRIETVFEDNEGQIWVGGDFGLFKLVQPDPEIQAFEVERIRWVHTRWITQNESGRLIVGNQQGLDVISKNLDQTYKTVHVGYSSNDRVICIGETIWTTSARGLSRYTLAENQEKPVLSHIYTSDLVDFHSLSKTVLRTIYAGRSGVIWIGTNGGGVNKFEPEHKIFFHHKKTLEKGTISYDKVRSVFEDKYQNLWVGTEGGGLNFLPYDAEDPANYRKFEHLPSPPNIFSLTEYEKDGKDYLLIGGQNAPGLYRIEYSAESKTVADLKMEPVKRITGSVFAVLNTGNRYIWAGTYSNGRS
ncbi:MAG: two-component regulator propeller domain-containing protein, partial [Bacteroidota bacterium]